MFVKARIKKSVEWSLINKPEIQSMVCIDYTFDDYKTYPNLVTFDLNTTRWLSGELLRDLVFKDGEIIINVKEVVKAVNAYIPFYNKRKLVPMFIDYILEVCQNIMKDMNGRDIFCCALTYLKPENEDNIILRDAYYELKRDYHRLIRDSMPQTTKLEQAFSEITSLFFYGLVGDKATVTNSKMKYLLKPVI
jgi:hypothetical protein